MRKTQVKRLRAALTRIVNGKEKRPSVSQLRKAKRAYRARRQGRTHNTNRREVSQRMW